MDITKAKKVVELSKDDKKILVTLWEGDKISSCIEEKPSYLKEAIQRCESCEGDEEVCEEYVKHLKEQGYEATEVELSELGVEESLPRFLEARELAATPVLEEPPVEE